MNTTLEKSASVSTTPTARPSSVAPLVSAELAEAVARAGQTALVERAEQVAREAAERTPVQTYGMD